MTPGYAVWIALVKRSSRWPRTLHEFFMFMLDVVLAFSLCRSILWGRRNIGIYLMYFLQAVTHASFDWYGRHYIMWHFITNLFSTAWLRLVYNKPWKSGSQYHRICDNSASLEAITIYAAHQKDFKKSFNEIQIFKHLWECWFYINSIRNNNGQLLILINLKYKK